MALHNIASFTLPSRSTKLYNKLYMSKTVIGSYFLLLPLLCACTTANQTPTEEIRSGREALLTGKPDVALTHFRRVTDADPNFLHTTSALNESVWTYIGRAYYNLGRLVEAHEAFGFALARNEEDFMARLYLGLTFLRDVKVQPAENALSYQDLIFALKERVTPVRVVSLVGDRGIKFVLTQDMERELRKLGGGNDLIQLLRNKSDAIRPAETARQQGLRHIERALLEMDTWLNQLLASPQGRFWDPRKTIRSQIKNNQASISTKNVLIAQVISGVEWLGQAIEEEVDLASRDEREKSPSPLRR